MVMKVSTVIICLGQSLMKDAVTKEFVTPPTLAARVSTAAKIFHEFYLKQKQKQKKEEEEQNEEQEQEDCLIFVSGADCINIGKTEASVMFELLIKANIPACNIITDHHARNTVENSLNFFKFLHDINNNNNKEIQFCSTTTTTENNNNKSRVDLILITNEFHIPRSTYIFEVVGFHHLKKTNINNNNDNNNNNNNNNIFFTLISHGSPNACSDRKSFLEKKKKLSLSISGKNNQNHQGIIEINEFPSLERLLHEKELLVKGAKQDKHFANYQISPNEILREKYLAKIDEMIRLEEEEISSCSC